MEKNKEFKIEALEKEQFRFAYISPVETLALATATDIDNFEANLATFSFALEHTEVKIGNDWLPVKKKGYEVYWPNGIEHNLIALRQICEIFMKEVIKPVFQKSEE